MIVSRKLVSNHTYFVCPLCIFFLLLLLFWALLFFLLVLMYRGSLPLALHEEAFSCLLCSIGQLGGGLPCSADPRVWLLDEVVTNLKERKSVVQVSKSHFF